MLHSFKCYLWGISAIIGVLLLTGIMAEKVVSKYIYTLQKCQHILNMFLFEWATERLEEEALRLQKPRLNGVAAQQGMHLSELK